MNMIIDTNKGRAKPEYSAVTQIKSVDVFMHVDPNHHQSHCYGEVVVNTREYRVYPNREPTFLGTSKVNLGSITLSSLGNIKARDKASRLLRSRGIEQKPIHVHQPTQEEVESYREVRRPVYI